MNKNKENFAVMRHASYTDSGKITETGHQQIATAAKKFMEFAEKMELQKLKFGIHLKFEQKILPKFSVTT